MKVRKASDLTGDDVKRRLFADDIFFRETFADYRRIAPAAVRGLEQCTFLLLKPETIVRRFGARILNFLRAHGYDVLGARTLRVGRHASRDMWRYQFNASPLSVMRAVDILFETMPVACLAVADRSGTSGEPASVRLAGQKGSHVEGIAPGSLRGLLGSPTLVLNFVHAPDEPADVLRELGVLFSPPERQEFLGMLLGTRSASPHEDAEAVMDAVYERHPSGELDPAASLARLEKAVSGPREVALAADIAVALREPQADERLMLLLEWLARAPENVSHWDRAVIAAFLVGHLRLVRPPLIGSR